MNLPCIGTAATPYGSASIHVGRYPEGGAIYVQLYTVDDECPEPLATLSTNLVSYGASLADDEFSVKTWSENEPLIDSMLDTDLFEDTGRRTPTGYAMSPTWRIKDRQHVPAVLRVALPGSSALARSKTHARVFAPMNQVAPCRVGHTFPRSHMNLSDFPFSAAALAPQDISIDVLREKYCKGDESTIQQVNARVADALAAVEPTNREQHSETFLWAMQHGFLPAGRIQSAAGVNPECGARALQRVDGCERCSECNHVGSCG